MKGTEPVQEEAIKYEKKGDETIGKQIKQNDMREEGTYGYI